MVNGKKRSVDPITNGVKNVNNQRVSNIQGNFNIFLQQGKRLGIIDPNKKTVKRNLVPRSPDLGLDASFGTGRQVEQDFLEAKNIRKLFRGTGF